MRLQSIVSIAIFISLRILVPGDGWAQAGSTVVPNANETVEGSSDNCLPWFCFTPVRCQQVYLGSEVGNGRITGIRFRQDGNFGNAFTAAVFENVTIALSSTTAAPDGLSMSFSSNVGPDETEVFSGSLMLSSATSTVVPRPFDVSIILATPFDFESSTGLNLLLDVTVPQTALGAALDYEFVMGDSVSRVTCHNDPACLTTDTALYVETGGLVTQFVFGASVIFVDGFESGTTSAWSTAIP